MIQIKKAIDTYAKMLSAEEALQAEFDKQLEALAKKKQVVSEYLMNNASDVEEIHDIIKEKDPILYWKICVKNDASAIEAYRILRDWVTQSNKKAKDFAASIEFDKDKIGAWLLAKLNASGNNSVNCAPYGKAYKKLKTQASAEDWDAFVKWAADNQAFDAIQRRVKTEFVNKYEEDHGELPPYLNVYREWEIIVTK